MSLIDSMLAIEAHIKDALPSVKIEKQTVPEKPYANLLVLRHIADGPREMETGLWYRIPRDYQIIYFSERAEQALPVLDELSNSFYDAQGLPNVPLRFLSFNFAQPELTENKLYGTVGVLRTEERIKRRLPTHTKINEVNPRIL